MDKVRLVRVRTNSAENITAYFHRFVENRCDSESHTYALVEFESGRLKYVRLDDIQFLDKPEWGVYDGFDT